MQDNKTGFLDVLRWAATIDVILYHILCASVSYTTLDQATEMEYNLIAFPMRWHVPMFLMISGALFLNPEKKIQLKRLYKKNICRLFYALLLFGYTFSVMEIYFNTRTINLKLFMDGFVNVLLGDTWAHLWYLYMLIGIYIFVPALKIYCDHASKQVKTYVLIVMFIFLSVFYEIGKVLHIDIGFAIPVSGTNLMFFLLGEYCMYELGDNKTKIKRISIIGISSSLLIIILNAVLDLKLDLSKNSPTLVILTVSLFLLAKEMNLHNAFLSKTKYLCFGMYLIHMIYINIAYKVLHISPFDYPLLFSVTVFGTIVILLSLLTSFLMNLIPPLRKHVL